MWWLLRIVPIGALLVSCAWAESSLIENEIKVNFPDPAVQASVRCIIEHKESFLSRCNIKPEILNYRNEDCDCAIPVNIIEFFLYNGAGLDDKKTDSVYFSPKMMKAMIDAGADYGRIVNNIAEVGSMQYFVALAESLEGPNGRMADGSSYLLHYSVKYWDQEKIDYLRSRKGFDWELRDFNGKTAILYGFSAGDNQASGFKRILQMIEYGADPRAVDYRGKGVCNYVRHGWPVENRVFAEERQALSKRLKDEFQMDCSDPSIP